MSDARCAGMDGFTEWEIEDQRDICRTCPVAPQCRDWGAATTMHVQKGGLVAHAGFEPHQLVHYARTGIPPRSWRRQPPTVPGTSQIDARGLSKAMRDSHLSQAEIARRSGATAWLVRRLWHGDVETVPAQIAASILDAIAEERGA